MPIPASILAYSALGNSFNSLTIVGEACKYTLGSIGVRKNGFAPLIDNKASYIGIVNGGVIELN